MEMGSFKWFASAVLARRGLGLKPVSAPRDGALDRFGSYLATAELQVPGLEDLVVASVHTPAREASERNHPGLDRAEISRPGTDGPWLNDVAFAGYRALVEGRRFVVGGDWNTSRWLDEHGVADVAGAAFFARAESAGWVEVSLDADGGEGKSWYGSSSPRTHQADHIFTDGFTATAVRSFAIEPWPVATLGLSDHAPLMLDLGLSTGEGGA
jgi:endonuclease/exonuclease/phosphatase family metal-dependent hydrolase